MTDEEFAAFCAEHPDLFFEMTAEGEIIVMPPAYSLPSARNSDINGQLCTWADRDSRAISVTNYFSVLFNNFHKIAFLTMLH
jgi:Uma2 family endonuclease